MEKDTVKPSPEAKALSLYLMAYKTIDPICKEKSKRINRQWDLVKIGEVSNSDYMDEVNKMLTSYGGYSAVVEKTVQFYIEKTGEWKLEGNDEYCQDARRIADKILKK